MSRARSEPTCGFEPELSIVMPCLNESETLAICIEKAQSALRGDQLSAEIIVADNGSTDGSVHIAKRMGAKVINVEPTGYGNALMGGIAAAKGRFVIMGDADDSYDFSSIQPLVDQLRKGHQLVMGNRFRGGIAAGAMPPLHRWFGNPLLSLAARGIFGTPVGDIYCGLRGFDKKAYEAMCLQSGGMEFATEMVIKSSLAGMKIAEVPIMLRPDGRSRPPHLRTWRDGFRTLRLMVTLAFNDRLKSYARYRQRENPAAPRKKPGLNPLARWV